MSSSSSSSNSSVFATSRTAVLAKIGAIATAGEEIRIWMPATSNFGHQATSILIMNRLIGMGATRIRIVYSDGAPGLTAWQKLRILILGLPADPAASFDVPGATIYFSLAPGYFTPAPASVTLGITGGWDGNSDALLAQIRVTSFCCLQPYLWTGTDTVDATNRVYILQGASGIVTYNFPGSQQLPLRSYYVPDPALTQAQIEIFTGIDARKSGCVGVIDALVQSKKAQLVPVYFSPGRPLGQAEDIFFNLITGILYYKQITKDAKPVIIPMMATSDPGSYDFLRDLMTGKVVDEEGTVESGDQYPNRMEYLTERGYFEAFKRVVILDTATLCTGDNISTYAKSGKYDIILAAIENVPKVIFDYVFGLTTLCHVFEGMGTASLALNLGKPFLHLQTSGAPNIFRLPPYETDPGTTPFGKYCLQASLAAGMDPMVWEVILQTSGSGGLPNVVIGKFLRNATADGAPLRKEFAALRTFYNNEEQDKLMGGLISWLANLNAGT
ncbi:MAG TPA: hypothetical protein VNZ86_07930 [Bacteroidia bacterium]|nr:hypothetical protein [Bacteroidia bacterium]